MKNKNNNKFSVSDLTDNKCTTEWNDTFNTCISNCGGAEECPSFDFNVCWRNHCHDVHACALVRGVPKKQADKERDKCIDKMYAPDWNNPKTNAERTRPNPSDDPWGTLDPGSCSPYHKGEYCGCWIKRGGRVNLDRDMSHLDCSMASESKHGFREEVIDPDGTSDTQQVTKVGQVGAGNCGCGSSAKSHRLQHEGYIDQMYKRVFKNISSAGLMDMDIDSRCREAWNRLIQILREMGYEAPRDGNTIDELVGKWLREFMRIANALESECKHVREPGEGGEGDYDTHCSIDSWCEEGNPCRDCALVKNPIFLAEFCSMMNFWTEYKQLMPNFHKDGLCSEWLKKPITG